MAVECARHFNTAIRWTFQIELNLVSIQRLLNYINLEPEEKNKKLPDFKPLGDIEFKDAEMKYQEHLQPSIQDMSFKINNGEKVAVVGRTGAGKSSVLQILFGFRQVCSG